jgi:DNA topoisomerase-1
MARAFIKAEFGDRYLPEKPNFYASSNKSAQEAHEAIRPTSIRREPDAIRRHLTPDQFRLYNLIWQRMVASQMADALFDVTTVDIEASGGGRDAYLLRATNTQMRFAGFRQVYEEGRDDGEEEDTGKNPLPDLAQGDALRLLDVIAEQRFTEPPPRYTEATLIKALEEKGIGRPSTYAPTMSTIQDRDYVAREGRFLKPTDLGFVVNDLLVEHFPDFVDVGFTAGMEDELDDIAGGAREWRDVVEHVYNPLEKALAIAGEAAPKQVQETDEKCHECGKPMVIRWGRRGRFLACTGYPDCKGTRPLDGEQREAPVETDEKCRACGSPMHIRTGRFGKFLACSDYPKCKGTRPLGTGVRCPRDGGDIVERRSRKGKVFFGCANYPKCDFVLWNRPLPQPCPGCGGLTTAERNGKAKCTACAWRGESPEAAAIPEPTAVP